MTYRQNLFETLGISRHFPKSYLVATVALTGTFHQPLTHILCLVAKNQTCTAGYTSLGKF